MVFGFNRSSAGEKRARSEDGGPSVPGVDRSKKVSRHGHGVHRGHSSGSASDTGTGNSSSNINSIGRSNFIPCVADSSTAKHAHNQAGALTQGTSISIGSPPMSRRTYSNSHSSHSHSAHASGSTSSAPFFTSQYFPGALSDMVRSTTRERAAVAPKKNKNNNNGNRKNNTSSNSTYNTGTEENTQTTSHNNNVNETAVHAKSRIPSSAAATGVDGTSESLDTNLKAPGEGDGVKNIDIFDHANGVDYTQNASGEKTTSTSSTSHGANVEGTNPHGSSNRPPDDNGDDKDNDNVYDNDIFDSDGGGDPPSHVTPRYFGGLADSLRGAAAAEAASAHSLEFVDRLFFVVSAIGVVNYLILLGGILWMTPPEHMVWLTPFERSVSVLTAASLLISASGKFVPILLGRGWRACSGIVVGAFTVQLIAFCTDCLLASCSTPVRVDPITGSRVFLLRWAEWAPLAGMMTFFTEGIDYVHNNSSSNRQGLGLGGGYRDAAGASPVTGRNAAFSDLQAATASADASSPSQMNMNSAPTPGSFTGNNNNDTSTDRSTHTNNTVSDHPIPWTQVIAKYWVVVKMPTAMAMSMYLSTLCGLIFPFCPGIVSWSIAMFVSCALFLVIFPRVLYKRRVFLQMSPGTNLEEMELYDRRKLSYRLCLTCSIFWSLLVALYFVGAFGHFFVDEHNKATSWLAHPSLPLVCDATMDVIAKAFYMDIITEVHQVLFDESTKSLRRLDELRRMVSVVWQCSSDIIALSVKGSDGSVTTMLSPTFNKIEDAPISPLHPVAASILRGAAGDNHALDRQNTPTIFEIEGKEFEAELARMKKNVGRDPIKRKPSSGLGSVGGGVANNDADADGLFCAVGGDSDVVVEDDQPRNLTFLDISDKCVKVRVGRISAQTHPGLSSMHSLVLKSWAIEGEEALMVHSLPLNKQQQHQRQKAQEAATEAKRNSTEGGGGGDGADDGSDKNDFVSPSNTGADDGTSATTKTMMQCEAKATRLGKSALVVVLRDISERYMRFEAEKLAIGEATARQKDAEANRFTRHEVKNGLLASIGLCDGLKEAVSRATGLQIQIKSTGSLKLLSLLNEKKKHDEQHMQLSSTPAISNLPMGMGGSLKQRSDPLTLNRPPPQQPHQSQLHQQSPSLQHSLKRPSTERRLMDMAATSSAVTEAASAGEHPRVVDAILQRLSSSASHAVGAGAVADADETSVDVYKYISELDTTLRDILDTVLAEAMARDVIHEVYEPKLERVDLKSVLYGTYDSGVAARFPFTTKPSPLPLLYSDPQLLKYIHRNAISNACKYGKKGGVVVTELRYDSLRNELEMDVTNLPGLNHEHILLKGTIAAHEVFLPGKKLDNDSVLMQQREDAAAVPPLESSGDGAWISRKCAKALGGDCSIRFEHDRTVFMMKCPVTTFDVALKLSPDLIGDPSKFRLPERTWGIAIDDSKVQRKLMQRFFSLSGIATKRQFALGETAEEIQNFTTLVKELLKAHPEDYFLLIVDENLDIIDHEDTQHTISGSLCIRQLRDELSGSEESRVLALVRSANDTTSDIAIYNSRAHGFICKAPVQKSKILEVLAPLWARRFAPILGRSTLDLTGGGGFCCDASAEGSDYHDDTASMYSDVYVAASTDIMQTLEVIDALCIQNESLLAMRWPVISEKLHSLKGDLKTMEPSQSVDDALGAINRLKGPSIPENFVPKWTELRSLIIRII